MLFRSLSATLQSRGAGLNLTWDANGSTTPNPSDGSGSWLTAGDWWSSGSGNVNGTWSGTTPDNAFFGAGTAGSYVVDMGAGVITASNITFTTSGYTLTNGTFELFGNATVTNNANVTTTINAASGTGATQGAASITANMIMITIFFDFLEK